MTTAYADTFKVEDTDVLKEQAILILAVIAVVYSLLQLLFCSVLDFFRLIFRKGQSKTPKRLRLWTYLTSLAALAVGVNFALFFIAIAVNDVSFLASWRFMVFAGLGLVLAGCAVYPLLTKARKGLSKGRLFLIALTSLSAMAIMVNIFYWSLYQWWWI